MRTAFSAAVVLLLSLFAPHARAESFATLAQCRSSSDHYYKAWETYSSQADGAWAKMIASPLDHESYRPIVAGLQGKAREAYRNYQNVEKACDEISARQDAKAIEDAKQKQAKEAEAQALKNAKLALDAKAKAAAALEAAKNPTAFAVGKVIDKSTDKSTQKYKDALSAAHAGDAPSEHASVGSVYDKAAQGVDKTSGKTFANTVQKSALDEIKRHHDGMMDNLDAYAKFDAGKATAGERAAPSGLPLGQAVHGSPRPSADAAQSDPPPRRAAAATGVDEADNPWARSATSSTEESNPWKASGGNGTQSFDPWAVETQHKAMLARKETARKAAEARKAEREQAALEREVDRDAARRTRESQSGNCKNSNTRSSGGATDMCLH